MGGAVGGVHVVEAGVISTVLVFSSSPVHSIKAASSVEVQTAPVALRKLKSSTLFQWLAGCGCCYNSCNYVQIFHYNQTPVLLLLLTTPNTPPNSPPTPPSSYYNCTPGRYLV